MNRRTFLRQSFVASAGIMLGRRATRTALAALAHAHRGPLLERRTSKLRAAARYERPVHDPCIIKEGDTYHLFCTGPHIWWRTSHDLESWELQGGVFSAIPAWAREEIPRADSLWAPDISFYNGKFHLYYSVSTFGSNRSCIGLATNVTLDSQSPDSAWVDEGKVVESNLTDDWNAIDPNLVIDENDQPWLAWGSFWTGIKMQRVDPLTGKLADDDTFYSLARRDLVPGTSGAIEAPFIIRHQNHYYLFVSFDFCCKGTLSTYKIMVGRAEKVTGRYFDRDGKSMLRGGGSLVVEGDDRWRGPGHNAVLQEPDGDKLVFHAYDAKTAGMPTLLISSIIWDADGWPTVSLNSEPPT